MRQKLALLLGLLLVLGSLAPGLALAGAVVPGVFNSNSLAANDDSFTYFVFGFPANYFGTTYYGLYVNNNGNVTFSSGLSTYTPDNLTGPLGQAIIAPFLADVDTRVGNWITYGTGTYGGHNAFGVNWPDVGYFDRQTDKLNNFQLILIDRSDVASGDFDIMFNYDKIEWDTGGGPSAYAGYSNGTGDSGTFYLFTGSGVNGAFLDGGVNALISNSNIGFDGRYLFEVRSGNVTPGTVPLPPSVLLMGSGLLGLVGLGVWRKHS